jgi:hypothetical protein
MLPTTNVLRCSNGCCVRDAFMLGCLRLEGGPDESAFRPCTFHLCKFHKSIPKLGTAVFFDSQVIPEDVNDLIATYRSL